MFDAIKLPAAALAGALAAGLLVFGFTMLVTVPNARSDERQLAEIEARKAIFKQLSERKQTDADVSKMPPGERCKLIGGVLVNGECS